MKLLKGILSTALIVSLSVAADYVIKFSHVVSPNTPKGKAADYFAKRVEELSKGRIKVEVYPNAQLGKDKVILRKMKFNAVQMAAPSFSKFTGLVPQLGLFDLPFLFKDENHLHRVLDGKVGQKLLDMVTKKGYVALAYWDNGFKQLTDSKRPLIKPDDCKGLKFRVMSSKVLIEQFKALGAIPVVLPFSEVYSALQQGVVDGQENTISNIYTKKFYEVQRYMTMTNHGYLGYLVVMSKKFWDKLPNDLKAVIKQAMKETTAKERVWAKELNEAQLNKIKEYAKKTGKLEIDYLTPQQRLVWEKKLRTIYPKFYNTIGKDLIKEAIKEGE
ncbi:TRAP transporter substrate-binding protein [Caminibacter mediatlanticus]|uniref:C4-dicarboxylate-binding periplasmic protein n=1 Tax=Caminibacter mediatlanticus TB-2 TaxID=391592 RepID=A0AAI9AH12_9BACT|nr:TRAP transporter substrate-binding protein [Caminibacter mediatlanticus]EDM23488.1 c4-dicarboxylate-binding periplasmic protein precursor [Caminibacter mediatlanticus TB-2]